MSPKVCVRRQAEEFFPESPRRDKSFSPAARLASGPGDQQQSVNALDETEVTLLDSFLQVSSHEEDL